jgi:hypothetical protein
MTENVNREKLVALLRSAHAAYRGVEKPPNTASTDWVDWYADFIIKGLQPKPSEEPKKSTTASLDKPESKQTAEAEPANSSAHSTSRLSNNLNKMENLQDVRRNQTEPDAKASQVCPTCAHRNRPGVLFCENCGTNLVTGQQSAMGTRDLREPQESGPDKDKDKKPTVVNETPPAIRLDKEQEQAVRSAGTSEFKTEMFLRIEVEGGSTPIVVKPKTEDMILGRRDPTTGTTPEVDLTSYAGYRMGVSRRHASLALENNQLNLWDLGSSNGTFINGNRLTPHQPHLVRDGDEIRLGQMVLRLFFQK